MLDVTSNNVPALMIGCGLLSTLAVLVAVQIPSLREFLATEIVSSSETEDQPSPQI